MTGHRPARRRVAAVMALTAAALTGACGVPTENRAQVIAAAELPYGLAGPERPAQPATGAEGSEGLEQVTLYFPVGGGLVAVPRELPSPVNLAMVVDALAGGGDTAPSPTRSAVGRGDVERVDIRAGVATVELDARIVDLPNAEQRVAVAQLVLTLTARPGVGQIAFTVGGDPVQVPRADGTLARSTVSRDDFIALVVS